MLAALAEAPATASDFLSSFFLWKGGLPIVLLGVAIIAAVVLAFRPPKREVERVLDALNADALAEGKKKKRSPTLLAVEDAGRQIAHLAALIGERDAAIERLRQQVEREQQQRDIDGRVAALQRAGEQLLTSYDATKRLVENAVTTLPSLELALRRFQEDMEVAVREHRKAILSDKALDSLLGVKRTPAIAGDAIPASTPAPTPAETDAAQSLPEEHPPETPQPQAAPSPATD